MFAGLGQLHLELQLCFLLWRRLFASTLRATLFSAMSTFFPNLREASLLGFYKGARFGNELVLLLVWELFSGIVMIGGKFQRGMGVLCC